MTTTTLLSQRASPRCCGGGLAWKALLDTGWHGFPASAATSVAGRRLACSRLARRVAREGRRWRERPPASKAGVAPSTVIPAGRRQTRCGPDRSGRGLLPESQTGFDVSDSVDSRHDLPHHPGVTQGTGGREAPFLFLWTSIMQVVCLLQGGQRNVLRLLASPFPIK